MLKEILIGNIISMSKGLGCTIPNNINIWIDLKEYEVILKNTKYIGFKVNFKIPEYFGLGKSVSKGLTYGQLF